MIIYNTSPATHSLLNSYYSTSSFIIINFITIFIIVIIVVIISMISIISSDSIMLISIIIIIYVIITITFLNIELFHNAANVSIWAKANHQELTKELWGCLHNMTVLSIKDDFDRTIYHFSPLHLYIYLTMDNVFVFLVEL